MKSSLPKVMHRIADRTLIGHELLICNNGGNSVTRHQVDCSSGCSIGSGEILLKKWLNLPDGICVSHA